MERILSEVRKMIQAMHSREEVAEYISDIDGELDEIVIYNGNVDVKARMVKIAALAIKAAMESKQGQLERGG